MTHVPTAFHRLSAAARAATDSIRALAELLPSYSVEERPGDTKIEAQHREDDRRLWFGPLGDLPPGYFVASVESWPEYDARCRRR